MTMYLVTILCALGSALLFHLIGVWKWYRFLHGRIDAISLTEPVSRMFIPVLAIFPAMYCAEPPDGRPFLALPLSYLFIFLLHRYTGYVNDRIARSVRLSPERMEELERTGMLTAFLAGGGLQ